MDTCKKTITHMLPDPSAVLPQPRYELVTTMFTNWVNRTPDNSAVCQGDCSWNYSELSTSAHALARVLLSHGINQGEAVAVFGPRSFGLIASMMGILLSGGVLLTIDPKLPSHRQQIMLQEAKAKHLLYIGCQRSEEKGIWESLAIICVNPDTGVAIRSETDSSKAIHLPQLSPDDAAYIFFTSGTSGVPKGVLGCHKGLAHFLTWQRQTFTVDQQDRSAQLTGLSFDVVLRDVFLPLTSGATLCLPTEGDELEPTRILNWLEREQISLLHTVPTLAQSWLVNVPPGVSLRALKCVFLAGEPLKDTLVRRWREKFPSGEIVNLYGPTETTLAKCYYRIPADILPGVQPIGSPLPETQALILAENNQLCGIGESGQIVLRTPFRSLGYINASIENSSRFVKNPFRNDELDLLYYTGDRGRYGPDGSLEILGRLDRQVKIRGVRIELGEIETVLAQHPKVRDVVVLDREDDPGDQRLVAYVVPQQEQVTTQTELWRFLKEQLPNYMLPSTFVMLLALPLTPNGKVDRRALPAPDTNRSGCEVDFVPPRTTTEEILVAIWAEILRLKQVGIYDNFFELGGHSLLATQVISRVRESFSVDLPLRCLFESPTVAELSLFVTKSYHESERQVFGIERVSTIENLPLSFAQARLWFITQLQPDSSAYNIPIAYRIAGQIDVVALKQSLGEIVQRHEALRTTFTAVNRQPVQVITRAQTLLLPVVDLQNLPIAERDASAERLAAQSSGQPFDLATGPLWRVQLLRLTSVDHLLLVTIHHIVFDEWSLNVFLQELAALYEAFSTGKPSPLPELPIQYADFAYWQRQWLQGEKLESQLNYWKQQLANSPPVLELPTDRQRSPVVTYSGSRQYLELPLSLTEAIKALSQAEGVTLFMTLLAAFKTLLYRYSGQSDMIVGSPIAGRNRSETEGLIGFFVNTLVLRTDLEGNPSFRELLGRIREVALGAFDHQDLPFEKLVEELQPERSLSYNPLFQVMFVFQNAPMGQLELPDLTLSPQSVEHRGSQFDLTLELKETASGLNGCFEYNTDLFDDPTITRMAGHFQTLLEGIVANPEQQVRELPLLTAAEQHQLLVWNHTCADYPQDRCIHQLFEAQVERTPDAVAVVFEAASGAASQRVDQHLTYRELNCRANKLAHHLQGLGVKPDVLVTLCVERSLEMVVGMLGILKAGGAYVPLDPAYPQERLKFMLSDSGASVLLTTKKLVAALPESGAQVVCLDTDSWVVSQENQQNAVSHVTAENLAYVIYTSGSTGQPKGVMILHKGICNQLYWRQTTFGLTEQDKVLQTISFSFDPSVWQIFWPLLFGAQLILARPGGHQDTAYLVKMIASNQITVIALVPSILRVLLEERGFENCLSLRHVTCGGEAMPVDLLERFFARLNLENVLHNCYGPTEASIDATTWTCRGGTDQIIAPIGRPIANTQIYILDENLQLVPVGLPGELHIGGVGLARGYLNRPELTAQKFIRNPSRSSPGARLYKTGDLARYMSDGNIEFLGRIDHQVKIRGFRIELGEIEAMLAQHPAIKQILVIAREDVLGDQRLVAYVVANSEQVLSQIELRSFLLAQLPEYMVPAAFVFLDTLPLNPNGKVNRRALPVPDSSSFSRSTSFVAPRDQLELTMMQIWSEVLGIQPIGVRDNFFDLGGHSLLAVRLFAQIEEKFGTKIPLSTLFQSGTVEALAQMIRQGQLAVGDQVLSKEAQDKSKTSWSSLVEIQPNGSKPPLFFLHPLGGEILCYHQLALHLGSEQPVYGLQPQGLDGKQPLCTQIEDMASHYIQEIQTIQRNGPYFLAGYSLGGIVAFEMAQQLQRLGEKVGILVMIDTLLPGYSTRSPFLKRVFLHLDHVLQTGPAYLWQKSAGWIEHGKYHLQQRHKRDLDIMDDLPETDKHLEVVYANLQALDNYVFQVYSGRITLLRTEDQNRDEEAVGMQYDPQFGWGDVVAGGIDIHYVPGSHLSLLKEPHVRVVAEKLQACLTQAQAAAQVRQVSLSKSR